MKRFVLALFFALCLAPVQAAAESICDADGVQASGSIYRICMPPPEQYNGILVVWAHGFQDAGTPVSIPEDQLCIGTFCIPEVINYLGFGFATNSYSKTGLAIVQGQDDVRDLVDIYAAQKGAPQKVYIVGASEGGIITALSVEQSPDVFDAGLAACGPIGDFPLQINYFGDGRATFQAYYPGLIPGDPFHPTAALVADWPNYYDTVVEPYVFHPGRRLRLEQWATVAHLPFDENDYVNSLKVSVRDMLRYGVVNLNDAAATLGGFPFDNMTRVYTGSNNDAALNSLVPRIAADPVALAAMNAQYQTSGVLERPLITLHTRKDQQVPYVHEPLYAFKTLASGALIARHLPITIERFEHCNFTPAELLVSFAIMLQYDNLLEQVTGTRAYLSPKDLAAFEANAKVLGIPTRRDGARLSFKLKKQR